MCWAAKPLGLIPFPFAGLARKIGSMPLACAPLLPIPFGPDPLHIEVRPEVLHCILKLHVPAHKPAFRVIDRAIAKQVAAAVAVMVLDDRVALEAVAVRDRARGLIAGRLARVAHARKLAFILIYVKYNFT
jgi:hypothetical protein